MYSVKIRDSIMIAHSLPDPFFGPAQNMHGATYVVDAEFIAEQLDSHNVVVDIGFAKNITKEVLDELRYKNLDEEPQFKGKLTTTEFVATHIHQRICDKLSGQFEGQFKITLGETHDAWASFQAPVSKS
jgi:6-pyruvoyl-tetrahydropterin synthase